MNDHKPRSLLENYLTPAQLADQLGVSPRTLSRWHAQRIGPVRMTMGRTILYHRDTVIEWLQRNTGHSKGKRGNIHGRVHQNCMNGGASSYPA